MIEAGIEQRWGEVRDMVSVPDAFLDFGPSRVGTEAWCVQRDWKQCSIIGAEPCGSRYAGIRDSYPGLLLNVAVCDKVGEFDGFENHYDFKVLADEDNKDPYAPVKIEAVTVDFLFKRHGIGSAFIWADIEGGEYRMLQGAVDALRHKKIVGLNLEIWSNPPVSGWPEWGEIVDFLAGFGYATREGRESCNRDYLFLP